MIPLIAEDTIGWIFLAVIFFGGSIAAFFGRLGDILMEFAGRPRQRIGKHERRELDRLRVENHELKATLLEVQAYDKFAVSPLPTDLSDRVNRTLAPKEVEK